MKSQASRESRVLRELGFVPAPTMSLDEVLSLLVEKTTRLMEAERSTLFLTAQDGTLVSRVLQGDDIQEIRLKPGQGIAGWSAARGIPVLVNDAPSDERFDGSWDQRFGFTTREVICRPVLDAGGNPVGAVEVLNKRSPGGFDDTDVEVLSLVANQIFLTIENFKLLHDLVRKNRDLAEARIRQERTNKEVVLLLKLERCVAESHDMDTLCDAVLRQTRQVTGAEAAMLYLHDTAGAELRWIEGELGIMKCVRCDERTGLLEQVARSGEAANENRISGSGFDIGIPRHAVIRMPMRHFAAFPLASAGAQANTVCGTLAVLNKEPGSSGFDEADTLFLSLIVDRLATAVAQFREREARERDRRLATVGRLMAGVLHDIRSPMSVISGYAELLGRAVPGPESEDYLSRMNAAVRRITAMAEEIIAFSKGEREMLFTKLDLATLIESFAADVRPGLEKRDIALNLSLKTGGAVVLDQDKMLRVFHNLVTNAAEAMTGRGRIVIETDRGDSETLFRFIDDGPGIPEKIRGVLFQSFVTHGKKQGTGLGLAVSKEIVEAHGGTIRFTTAMGHGTTFIVTIPDRIVS